jgi:hypothetical protein
METDRLAARLQELPPDLPDPPDRFDRVRERVSRTRRRQIAGAVVGGLAVVAVAVPATMQLLPENAAPPAQPGPVGEERGSVPQPWDESTILPGGTAVSAHGDPVTATNTGTSTVQLGDRPEEASAVSIQFWCLDAGTFTWPDGNTTTCGSGDATASEPNPPWHILPLAPGEDEIVIEATAGASWKVGATYVSTEVTEWGVNANGDTYGIENVYGSPDLVAVTSDDGRQGYAYADDLLHGGGPGPTSPADATARQEANAGKVLSIPVYEADGETVIGQFSLGGGSPAATEETTEGSLTTAQP